MPQYHTLPALPGIHFEIYFPKKIDYQAALYTALRDGHNQSSVIEFLRREEVHVRPLLPPALRDHYGARMLTMHQVYFGFSMYEVDGVFFDQRKPLEDRTQVIRLIVYPPYQSILHGVKETLTEDVMEHVRLFRKLPLSLSKSPTARYLRTYVDGVRADDELRAALEVVLPRMEQWIQDAYIFVFGYVIGQLTLIARLQEKEIWVVSYRSAVVNRIIPVEPERTEPISPNCEVRD